LDHCEGIKAIACIAGVNRKGVEEREGRRKNGGTGDV